MSDNNQGPTVAQSQAQEVGKKKHHHWWQDVPRRLSLTRNRTMSETSNEDIGSPTEDSKGKKNRRFSESSTRSLGKESAAEIRERWNQNYNIPPECFVPPWF